MLNKSIIFMGTPDFASEALKVLSESNINIKAVVTQPDKERGRGRKVSYTPVKQLAIELGIPVIQPVDVKQDEFKIELEKYNADLFVVVAFSILPQKIINIAKIGTINLHASLLPNYRGAAPINYALFNGEEKTGLSIFFLSSGKVDSGSIVDRLEVKIDDDDNFETLYDKLKILGSTFLKKQVENIFAGNYKLSKQDITTATHLKAPKIFPKDFLIDWNKSSFEINNKIRGLAPKPGAFTGYKNKRLKILKALPVLDFEHENQQGEVLEINKKENYCLIACKNNALKLLEVQPEGKAKMNITAFINGYQLKVGDILEINVE